MRMLALTGLMAMMSGAGPLACSYSDPTEPWEDLILLEPVIFVGEVMAIEPGANGNNIAVLRVETPVRGELGTTFRTPQNSDGGCYEYFEVGQKLLFAGNYAWSPTTFLSTPLTTEQRRRLAIVRCTFFDAAGDRLPD